MRHNRVWIRPEGSLRTREMESAYDIAYDNPSWNLSGKETVGVVAVGAGLAFIVNKMRGDEDTGTPLLTGLAAGTMLYTLGVVIGTNRPAGGFIK